MPERRAWAEEGDARRTLQVTRGRQDLTVDGPEVVATQAPLDESAEPGEDLGLARGRVDRSTLRAFPSTDLTRDLGSLRQQLYDLLVQIVHPLAQV
jgi:hypothetical protein